MKLRKILFIATLTASCTTCSLSAMASDNETITISGQDDWYFRLAKGRVQADSLVSAGFYTSDFQPIGFSKVYVPSNWAVQGYEEPVYRGFSSKEKTENINDDASEGLYIKRFTLPESFDGKRILLHFGGVWNSAEVWLNNRRMGRHDSGYTSFAFDATGVVKKGENVLAVRVRQTYPGYKTDTYDDWTLGGIYRDVTLEAMPRRRRIDRVTATTYMNGEVDVRVMVADEHKNTLPGNYSSPTDPYQVRLTLADANGQTVASETVDVTARASSTTETRRKLQVSSPRFCIFTILNHHYEKQLVNYHNLSDDDNACHRFKRLQ